MLPTSANHADAPQRTGPKQLATSAARGGLAFASALLACALLLLPHHAGLAQSAATSAEAQRKLEMRRLELEETRKREQTLQSDLKAIDEERERLNQRLVETAGLIQKSEAQLTTIESRIGELEIQERMVRGSLDQRQGAIAKLLAALQRMGRNPPPVLITKREDALEMVRSAMLLASAFPELKSQADVLIGQLNELVRVKTDIKTEGDRLRAETQRLSDARTRLAALMETKRQSLAERQQELADVRRAAADITRSVGDLSELIQKLDREVAQRTQLAAYERELQAKRDADLRARLEAQKQAETAVPAIPPQAVPVPVVPDPAAPARPVEALPKVAMVGPPKIMPPAVELAPRGTTLAMANPGRLKPAIPFEQAKAQLPLPGQGKRVLGFGERIQTGGGRSKGMVIETRHGAQIISPTDGWIVYAGAFRAYGQLLIINAGAGYHIVLAGLSQIDVQIGQFVLAAEPVGTMAPALRGVGDKGQGGAPVLYVEFRKEGRPIDPDPWWVAGQQKVN